MPPPSTAASNAIIYSAYGLFLALGLALSWRVRRQTTDQFLAANRTQKALPLALSLVASGLGSSILFTYPELATLAGVQGVVTYALASALPLLALAGVGVTVRRACPDGFVLTEWTRRRYGPVAAGYLGLLTLLALFLFMVAELAAVRQAVEALTGMDGLPVIVVECVVSTISTTLGGFRVSFLTNVVQGVLVVTLVAVVAIAVGTTTTISPALVVSSGLTGPSRLGWQLLYILPVAILTSDFLLSQFWLRVFSARTDGDLWRGAAGAAAVLGAVLAVVGAGGLVAVWSGALGPDEPGSAALFALLAPLPAGVVGVALAAAIVLSGAAFEAIQLAMVSGVCNDVFRRSNGNGSGSGSGSGMGIGINSGIDNGIGSDSRISISSDSRSGISIWPARLLVVLATVPVVVLALRVPSVLAVYLLVDLLAAAAVPALALGLSERCAWWRGPDVVAGGLGGLLAVFCFGAAYYGDAARGARLLLLVDGLYADDWSVFGAFVAAPVGGLLSGLVTAGVRRGSSELLARLVHTRASRVLLTETNEPMG